MGTEAASSSGKGALSSRLRRKSAKAAAALVSAVAKEEVTLPEQRPTAVKRSYARSHSAPTKSSTRVASTSSSSGTHANKKKTALSQHAVHYLKNWMLSPAHIEHPYPTEEEKIMIMKATGIEIKQLTNWFVNNRKRYWKPKVEEYKRRSSESNLTIKQIAAEEWSDLDENADSNAIVSDTDNEKSQPKKKKQRTSLSSSKGGGATSKPNKAKRSRDAKGKQQKTSTPTPVLTPGIAVAKSHATVKAVNAMRYVGETSSSDEDLEEDAATIFSSSTVESKVNDTSANDVITSSNDAVSGEKSAPLPLEWANGFCGCVADPLSYKITLNGEPCPLCAACRDWNAGEFCPWDLTGLIGNINSDPLPSSNDKVTSTPVERTVSESEIDLDAKMTASPSSSTFETPQDATQETWEIADTW